MVAVPRLVLVFSVRCASPRSQISLRARREGEFVVGSSSVAVGAEASWVSGMDVWILPSLLSLAGSALFPSESLALPRADWHTLPNDLISLGTRVFGSRAALSSVVNETAPPMAFPMPKLRTQKVWLVQRKGDNSNVRLIKEFKHDTYGVKRVTEDDGVIVDVGANIGDFTISSALCFPSLQVVGVEAVPTTYFFFRWNLFINRVPILERHELGGHRPGVFALNAAVVAADPSWAGRAKSLLSGPPMVEIRTAVGGGSSQDASLAWVHTDADDGKRWLISRVPGIDLPTLTSGLRVRLLKIDCEGCEYDVAHASPSWLASKRHIQRFTGEMHLSLGLGTRAKDLQASVVHASADKVQSLRKVLKRRGCQTNAWKVQC